MKRAHPLWRRLVWLSVAALAPLALIAGVGAAVLLEQQREQAERASLDFTRAVAGVIEGELGRSVAVLGALAQSPMLDGDLDAVRFRELTLRLLGTLPDWRAIILIDPYGRVVTHTSLAGAAAPPPVSDPDSFRRALIERKPLIGQLARGPGGQWGVAVRYPVQRDGRLLYVLSGVLKPEVVQHALQRQRLPADRVVAVLDARERLIARSRTDASQAGGSPSPSLRQLLSSPEPQGTGMTTTLEGDEVYTAYVRLADSGWTVAAGLPSAALRAEQMAAAGAYGAAVVLSLLLAALIGLLFARRIDGPIAALSEAARALGRGEPPAMAPTGIVEVDEVATTLRDAARERARSEAERDALLSAERHARGAAEAARRRLELLAASGASLAHSLQSQATLEAVARAVVPAVVDWCSIDLLDDEGHPQRAIVHHADAQRREAVSAVAHRERPAADTEGSMAWAVRTGRSLLLRFADEAAVAGIADPALRAIVHAMGTRVHLVVPLLARGRTLGAMAVAQADSGRDIDPDDRALLTELAQRAALAIDNARLYAAAERSRAQAESANRAKDEFLAMLGHELRNPLAPIVTSLQLMRLRHAGVAERERGIIERQVSHLSRLVDDLLDVSRIAQGKVQIERRRIDLRDVIDKAIELTAPAFDGRAPLQVQRPDGAVAVDGDEVRLVQVVCNLLTNAVKYTAAGGAIRLALSSAGEHARIEVADDGMGIAPALLPQVFEFFVQGEQALDRRSGGLGLGLGIVRLLVQLHGGDVAAHSDGAGRGSRFVVRLPLAAAEAAAPERPAAPAPAPRPAARVLLVDDNLDAAQSLAELLRLHGHAVEVRHDGAAALDAVGAGYTPDVALLDIGLPGMNGYELAAALRAQPRLAGLRLIALTGYGREPDRARALSADFDAHLVKPVSVETLLQAMAAAPAAPARYTGGP